MLNGKFIDAEFEIETANEHKLAYKLLENHVLGKNIILYDRGFPSVELIQELEEKGYILLQDYQKVL